METVERTDALLQYKYPIQNKAENSIQSYDLAKHKYLLTNFNKIYELNFPVRILNNVKICTMFLFTFGNWFVYFATAVHLFDKK